MLRNRLLLNLLTLPAVLLLMIVVPPGAEGSGRYKVLHSFGNGDDGAGVWVGMAIDSKGNLYGVTNGGGAYGYGTVFELMPSSGGAWTETILHNFCQHFPPLPDDT